MPRSESRGLTAVAPEPVDDEQRPLLDEQHPDHGTISQEQAAWENGEAQENGVPIAEEPSTGRILLVMLPLFLCAFLAAMGKNKLLVGLDRRTHTD